MLLVRKVNFRYVLNKKISTFTFQQFCAKNLLIQPKPFKLFVQKHGQLEILEILEILFLSKFLKVMSN